MTAPVEAPRAKWTGRVGAYARLAKFDVPQVWAGVAVGWSLIPADEATSGRAVGIVVLSFLTLVGATSATQALDDVTGFLEGSDEQTYRPGQSRRRSRKPLLDGELSVAQAKRFGYASIVVSLASLLALSVSTSFRPLSLYVLAALVVLFAVQYSYGARVSYRLFGGSELVVGLGYGYSLLVPVVATTGEFTALAATEAVLWATWIVLLTMSASSNDAPIDRASGRRTIAAVLAAKANTRAVVVVAVLSWAIAATAVAVGPLPLLAVLTLAPTAVLHALLLRAGPARGDWLAARLFGFRALAVGAAGLVVANVLT